MTPRWRWILVAITALAVACLAPGSLLSRPASATAPTASIEPTVPAASGSECAAVACNPGSASSSGPTTALAVVGVLALAMLLVAAVRTRRRPRQTKYALPAGTLLRLFRPPQLPGLHS